ncbi:thioredoxin family protein [Bacillaceae bacterium Marseille-Q3522]|nr:thioredoxin family protein [Bacillaceae bacterium Marseille-Q3522]
MEEWKIEDIAYFLQQKRTGLLYLYTPLCGTCQIAAKMLTITEKILPELTIGKSNLNYVSQLAEKYFIESVPCLLFIKEGEVIEKIYAFHSVLYLAEKIQAILI